MTTAELTPALDTLAAQINDAHDAYDTTLLSALEKARDCGRLLIDAKGAVQRGEWLKWLKENIRCTPRTCQYYMKVAEQWEKLADKNETVSHLTLKSAIKLLAPEKPSRFISVEQYNSDEHQQFLRFVEGAVKSFKWSASRELIEREEQKAKALEEQLHKIQAKARHARTRVDGLKERLEAVLRQEFEKQRQQSLEAVA